MPSITLPTAGQRPWNGILNTAINTVNNAVDDHEGRIELLEEAPSGGGVWGSISGTLSAQTDLQNALDAKVPTTRTVNSKALTANISLNATDVGARASNWVPAWGDVSGKPSTFPPAAHGHAISDVTDLQDELDTRITSPNGSVSQIEWYASVEDFPATGVTGGIYLTDKAE